MRPTSLIFFAILAVVVFSAINLDVAEYAVIGAISAAVMLIMLVIANMFNPFKIQWYYIFKGWHYSFQSLLSMITPFVRMYNSDKKNIIACIRFNRTSWYDQSVVGDHWNKLIGVAAGNVHKNSVRIAWRPNSYDIDKIDICFYTYESGKRIIHHYFSIKTDNFYYIIIEKGYIAISNDRTFVVPVGDFEFAMNKSNRFLLLPYFGGRPRSPHRINVFLDVKKIKISD